MILFKIGIISLEYDSLILFILGIILGAIIFGLIFLIIMLSTRKNKKSIIKSKARVSYEADVVPIKDKYILKYQNDIEDIADIARIFDIAYKMSNDIATLFFPKSDKPLFELSLDEVIALAESLSDAFDKAVLEDKLLKKIYTMDSKILKMVFKDGIKISTLYGLKDKRIEIESELKEAKENVFSRLKKNIINKVKGIGIKASIKYLEGSHIVDRISMLFINVAASETFKAFNKKIYNEDLDIDTSLEDVDIEEIETNE